MTDIRPPATDPALPDPASEPTPTGTPVPAGVAPATGEPAARRRREWTHFALRNRKVVGGTSILLAFLLTGLIAPLFLQHGPRERNVGPPNQRPNAEFWLGTTSFGEDIFAQFAYGIRSTFLVAVLAAAIAAVVGMTIGFVAGYRGGMADETLMILTNIFLVLPVFVVLIVITAYIGINSAPTQAVIIGLFSWPWVARAVRAQTLTLRSRDYVDLARLTGYRTLRIVRTEVAPNMGSYLAMVFILLFAGAVLFAAALDFLGLGPRQGMSLGLMLQLATEWGGIHLGWWWWFIPPGAAITMITGAAYLTNVGLDEVFNPKLRET